jgi:hypothetical protein
MKACSVHNPNKGGVAMHHLFGGLTGAASRIDPDLLTNSESRHATGKVHFNVHAWFEQGQTYRRLDGIEEAMQS